MSILGNILWLILGGFLIALEYFIAGILLCITIVGIPFGYQSFKLGVFAMFPFGQTTVVDQDTSGCLYTIMNIIWLLIGGIWIALTHLALGVILCVTIIGIPFGIQHFKLMSMAFTPFGRDIVSNK